MFFKGSHIYLCNSFLWQVRSLPTDVTLTIAFNGGSSDSSTSVEKVGMPGAAVISALTLIYIFHRALVIRGFTLRRRGLFYSLRNREWPPIWPSTDFLVSLELLAIATVWTIVVFYTAFQEKWDKNQDGPVCQDGHKQCISSVANAPWFLLVVGVFWSLSYVYHWAPWREALRWIFAYLSAFTPKKFGNSHQGGSNPGESPIDHLQRQKPALEGNSTQVPEISDASSSRLSTGSMGAPKAQNSTTLCKGQVLEKFKYALALLFPERSQLHYSDWYTFIGPFGYTFLSAIVLAATGATIWSSWSQGLKSLSLISAVACVIFIFRVSAPNAYAEAPHRYTGDVLRVVFPTREDSNIVYILPSKDRGFDAVYCPKISFEHKEIERLRKEVKNLGRDGEPMWHEDNKIFFLFDHFIQATELKKEELERLARWLFCVEEGGNNGLVNEECDNSVNDRAKDMEKGEKTSACVREWACIQRLRAHLLGKNLLFSLWLLEFLIYDKRYLLDDDLRQEGRKFKWRGESGNIARKGHAIGDKPGKKGYEETVKYIYELFGTDKDHAGLRRAQNPSLRHLPEKSVGYGDADPFHDRHSRQGENGYLCDKIRDFYIENLWNYCIEKQDSTFGAIYAFSCYWCHEVGYDIADGSHHFPLVPKSDKIDRVGWHIIWRQGWYNAIVVQTILLIPGLINTVIPWLWLGAWITT